MSAFTGNYHILDTLTGAARTVTGRAIDPDAAATVLAAVEGLTDIVAVDPEPVGGMLPVGQWEATDPDGRSVSVRLWREIPIHETAVGAALKAAFGEQEV